MTRQREEDLAIDIPYADIWALEKIAAKKGVSCEQLAASILHKYITGQLKAVD